jgi:hypothetical protein
MRTGRKAATRCTFVAIAGVAVSGVAAAQSETSAREAVPYDLEGYWVSIVTEDWLWRMMTPPRGDYASVPLTDTGRAVADAWDPQEDERTGNGCRPYGAGGIMRVPGRLHITWQDDETLRIDTDAGSQTRLLHFAAFEPATEPTWQGNTRAEWMMTGGGRGRAPTGGSLMAVTTGARLGYVRWNGVAYGEQAEITEHFDRYAAFDREWLTVTTIIEDAAFFTEPFIVSSDFVREPDDSAWNPTPCVTEMPAIGD